MGSTTSIPARRGWGLLLLLMIGVKALLVLSLADVFFWGEELEKGVAAKAMIDGLDVPHHQLAYRYFEGGGFVASHLTALGFLVLGQNLLAHKLVALGFQLAILIVGCRFSARLFGARAALWFGVLFVLGPECYQKLSLLNLGTHFEACLFLFGVLGLGARILFGERGRPRDYLALGLVAGFGVYYSYQVIVAVAWVGLLLVFLRRRELLGRAGVLGLVGALLGALPLWVMYARVGGAVFDIHTATILASEGLTSNFALVRGYVQSIFLEGSAAERVAPVLWTVAFVGAVLLLLGSRSPEAEQTEVRGPSRLAAAYVLGYMLLLSAVFVASGFVQGRAYHFFLFLRLVPLWVFAAVLVAAALGRLSSSAHAPLRRLAWSLGTPLVLAGVYATLSVLGTGRPAAMAENWHLLTHQKGYDYDQYFGNVFEHFDGNRLRKLQLVESFDEPAPALLRAAATENLFREGFNAAVGWAPMAAYDRALAVMHLAAEGDEERMAEYELGLGALLYIGHEELRDAAVERILEEPEERRRSMLEALGRFGGDLYPLPGVLRAELAWVEEQIEDEDEIEREDLDPYLRGLGRWAYSLHRRDPAGFESFLAEEPEVVAARLREGFEAERALHLGP